LLKARKELRVSRGDLPFACPRVIAFRVNRN
jgi:hypothetical protein